MPIEPLSGNPIAYADTVNGTGQALSQIDCRYGVAAGAKCWVQSANSGAGGYFTLQVSTAAVDHVSTEAALGLVGMRWILDVTSGGGVSTWETDNLLIAAPAIGTTGVKSRWVKLDVGTESETCLAVDGGAGAPGLQPNVNAVLGGETMFTGGNGSSIFRRCPGLVTSAGAPNYTTGGPMNAFNPTTQSGLVATRFSFANGAPISGTSEHHIMGLYAPGAETAGHVALLGLGTSQNLWIRLNSVGAVGLFDTGVPNDAVTGIPHDYLFVITAGISLKFYVDRALRFTQLNLEGMAGNLMMYAARGIKAGNGGNLVDVWNQFQYAANEVPTP